jgi:osmoprotectant transport system ATP-binding protein
MEWPVLIELDHVTKSFDAGQTFAVRDFSLRVHAGAFISIVGASGSGKTTILKCINRLIELDSGEIRIKNERINLSIPWKHRRQIGYVFQGIGLFPHMNVADNIGITPKLLGWPSTRIAARTMELLELVGLPQSYLSRSPNALSGGEQQRAAVARAIAARPSIVLMDEPFGALDPITRDNLGAAYHRIHKDSGLTTIMVTHDVQEALLLSDYIVVMSKGRILESGTPKELMLSPPSSDVGDIINMPRRQAERIRDIMQ